MKKIQTIPISINNIDDKIAWKFRTNGEFSVKIATWASNDFVGAHLKAKFINSIWKLI